MSLKRLLLLLGTICVLLACAPAGFSQQTQVSGQVLDPRGFAWQAGTGNFSIQCTGNSQPYINGSPVSRTIPLVKLSGTGSFSQALWDTSFITDVNGQVLSCQWHANFLDSCGVATFGVNFTGITGTAVNVTSQISAVSVNLSAACTPPGILNSVTLSNLNPLFNVTKTGTLTDPIFTFSLQNAPAGTVYGNPSGSSAPPSFNSLSAYGGLVNSVTGTTNQIIASPTTGNVVLSFPTAVQMPGSLETVNGITSDSGDITAGNRLFATFAIVSINAGVNINSNAAYVFNGGSLMAYDSLTQSIHFKVNGGGADAPIIASGATLSGISSGNCLQTTTGGLIQGSGSPCNGGVGPTQIETGTISSPCTPPSSSSFDACDSTVTWGHSFANTTYNVSCTAFGTGYNGGNSGTNLANLIYVKSRATGSAVISIQNARGAQNTPTEVDCIAAHP